MHRFGFVASWQILFSKGAKSISHGFFHFKKKNSQSTHTPSFKEGAFQDIQKGTKAPNP
jgi:hypothetical protein